MVSFAKISLQAPDDDKPGTASASSSSAPSPHKSSREIAALDFNAVADSPEAIDGLDALSPTAATQAAAMANPVLFENDVHYRETFPFWSRRKLVVRNATIDIFNAPGSDKNLSLPLDKVIVLRLGNNAIQHEVSIFVEETVQPVCRRETSNLNLCTIAMCDVLSWFSSCHRKLLLWIPSSAPWRTSALLLSRYLVLLLRFRLRVGADPACSLASSRRVNMQSRSIVRRTRNWHSRKLLHRSSSFGIHNNRFVGVAWITCVKCKCSTESLFVFQANFLDVTEKQRNEMDNTFLRYSVGLTLVFHQFREQANGASKKKLHHSAMHPHKGHDAAGIGRNLHTPKSQRTSLIVGTDEEEELLGPLARRQPSDFLNVYYLDAGVSSLGTDTAGIAGGSCGVSEAKFRDEKLHYKGGDDTCVLHHSFNFTFAEKFGNSDRTLMANVTRIELPDARGRAVWRGDLPWEPVVRTPLLMQIRGTSLAQSDDSGTPSNAEVAPTDCTDYALAVDSAMVVGFSRGRGTSDESPEQGHYLRFHRLCLYSTAAPRDHEAEKAAALAAQEAADRAAAEVVAMKATPSVDVDDASLVRLVMACGEVHRFCR